MYVDQAREPCLVSDVCRQKERGGLADECLLKKEHHAYLDVCRQDCSTGQVSMYVDKLRRAEPPHPDPCQQAKVLAR
jgi:hypothetical protein